VESSCSAKNAREYKKIIGGTVGTKQCVLYGVFCSQVSEGENAICLIFDKLDIGNSLYA